MKASKFSPRRKKVVKTPQVCLFCTNKKNPDYKEYKFLRKFISDRSKIMGKDRTGVCSKHQRKLSKSVKRARHLGLLPFTPPI